MTAPILFVGDIHLGRRPHRLASLGLDLSLLGPAEAWRRTVQAARDRGVQAVVLAGDVVDQDKDRFEAWSHLRDGVGTLVAAGVRVLGVAGNHDHLALPRLADRIPDFHLLGAGGIWERVELDGLDLLGWSFPARHHRGDPLHADGLEAALAGRRTTVPAVGVLHADLDASGSPYAPVRRADLEARALDAWFLGHIHSPGDLSAARPIGYLGSLVGLDRGEVGPRGPWEIHPQIGGGVTASQLPLGPVLWLEAAADVAGIEPGDDALDRLHVAVQTAVQAAVSANRWLADGDFAAVGLTVTLQGRTAARRAVRTLRSQHRQGDMDLVFPVAGVPCVVVRLRDETRPDRDLAALAAEQTPLGQLARLVIDLDNQGEAAIPAPVAHGLNTFDSGPWTPDSEAHPPPTPLVVARRAAVHLLDELLTQRDAQGVA